MDMALPAGRRVGLPQECWDESQSQTQSQSQSQLSGSSLLVRAEGSRSQKNDHRMFSLEAQHYSRLRGQEQPQSQSQSQQSHAHDSEESDQECDHNEEGEESTSASTPQRSQNTRRAADNRNSNTWPDLLSPVAVIRRIESLTQSVVQALADHSLPELRTVSDTQQQEDDDTDSDSNDDDGMSIFASSRRNPSSSRSFVFHNMQQCRSFASILLVLSFCHSLLLARRTTTTREVYYFYVTHFRSQKECDAAIVQAANLLQVPRSGLGLYASPKGWFCGCLQIIRNGRVVMDGQSLSSMQGAPITNEWLTPPQQRDFTIDCRVTSNSTENSTTRRAKCILVIEKEGVYNRFSEDRLYERYPCILVTGKGFPDLATRSLVHSLHHQLQLPVFGLADCNPYGMLVLQTYQYGSTSRGIDGGVRYSVPIHWLGLRPSQMERMIGNGNGIATLPSSVYQQMTELDHRRLEQLLDESHKFHGAGRNEHRYEELEIMRENDYKVELEALNWLGMDYLGNWVYGILTRHDQERAESDRGEDDDSDAGHVALEGDDKVEDETGSSSESPPRTPAII